MFLHVCRVQQAVSRPAWPAGGCAGAGAVVMSNGCWFGPALLCPPASMRANLLTETQGESGYCVYCIDWHGCSSGWCPSAGTLQRWLTNNLMRLNTHAGPWLGFSTAASPPQCHCGFTHATLSPKAKESDYLEAFGRRLAVALIFWSARK